MVLPGSPSRACLHRYHRTDPGNALPSCRNHGQRRRTSPLSEAVIQPAQRAHGLRVQQRAAQRAGNPTRDCPAAWQPRARRPTPTSWLLRVHTLQRACERTVDQGEGRWVRRVGWPGRAQGHTNRAGRVSAVQTLCPHSPVSHPLARRRCPAAWASMRLAQLARQCEQHACIASSANRRSNAHSSRVRRLPASENVSCRQHAARARRERSDCVTIPG